jgi:hypothetical protein
MEEQEAYLRDLYLIVDSYGPVYGLLNDRGRTLFVADGTKNEAYLYDLTRGYGGKRIPLTDELISEYEKAITQEIQKVQTFYKFQPPEKTTKTASTSNTIVQLYSLLFSE